MKASIPKTVSQMISGTRHQAGLTQEDLAKKLGWSRSKVVRMESGKRRIDVAEFIEVAKALDVPPELLLAKILQWVRCVDAWYNGKPFHEAIKEE
jgi:transcriptional regulator with XRE-family HTH domain